MIEEGIVSLLNANGPLSALVSAVYPVFIPEDAAYPCLSYQTVSRAPEYTFAGESFYEGVFQFDCWSMQYAEAKAVQKALRNALDVYQGTLSEGTQVLAVFRTMDADFFEEDSRFYRAMSEYTFHYVEP
jgi:hypothetical protein